MDSSMTNKSTGKPQSTHTLQHRFFLPGSCPMLFHHGQGTLREVEAEGKEERWSFKKTELFKIQSKGVDS